MTQWYFVECHCYCGTAFIWLWFLLIRKLNENSQIYNLWCYQVAVFQLQSLSLKSDVDQGESEWALRNWQIDDNKHFQCLKSWRQVTTSQHHHYLIDNKIIFLKFESNLPTTAPTAALNCIIRTSISIINTTSSRVHQICRFLFFQNESGCIKNKKNKRKLISLRKQ